jgi:hypothetical protein
MNIKWAEIGQVAGIGLVVTVVTVLLFSLAIVGMSRVKIARTQGGDVVSGAALASVCLAICVVIAGSGIYAIATGGS